MSTLQLWGQYLPQFLAGLVVSLQLTGAALVLALALGTLLVLARTSRIRILAGIATGYVEVFRAVPVLVLLFTAYYSLAEIGLRLPGFWAGVVALGAFYGTLYGEDMRSGLQSVDVGQREAAVALGLSNGAVMRRVVLPQAFLAFLPPGTNELSNLIKDTSLVLTIGVADLMFQANAAAAATFQPMDMFLLAGVVYFAFYILLSRILARWELNVQRRRS